MSLRYVKHLVPENINKIASEYGFAVPLNLERFIMDFELQYQISQYLDCTVRGGMCVPFHIDANRLSVDIDLITNDSMAKIEQAMENISNEFSNLIIKKIEPSDPLPVKNLISFAVEFTSCFGGTAGIKIDFISDMDEEISRIESQYKEIFSIPIDHKINILTHGALIGDKISTLSLNKIGVPQNSGHVPKQIFDIASLINLATKDILIETMINFEKLTNHKIRNYTNTPTPTKNDVLNDIDVSLTSLLTTDITLTTKHNSIYGSFTSTLLGARFGNYSKPDHIRDILLTKLIAKSLSKQSNQNIQQMAEGIEEKINEAKRLKNLKPNNAAHERISLLDSISTSSQLNKKILKNIPLDHLYLVTKCDE